MYTCSQNLGIDTSSCLCCTCSLSTGINVAGFGMYSIVSAECVISPQMLAAALSRRENTLRLPFLLVCSDSAGLFLSLCSVPVNQYTAAFQFFLHLE